ncbi:hypothetical protein HB991_13495 [Yersinia mollaretii]|uniref:Uncharacterized protein n=1 Tax=Yersinia mollaretii TaxID=33060 RepID=A0AA44I0L1_YERMO|nr:hypothetical protein [Yersinia mollaretii]NIL23519.1 hypothetical protein [Yersinia mollaretii]
MLSKERLEKIANPVPADIGGTQSPIVTQMAIELLESRAESLSLREQLEALRALPAVAVLYRTGEVITRAECADDRTFDVCCKVETRLFTAAKPTGGDNG